MTIDVNKQVQQLTRNNDFGFSCEQEPVIKICTLDVDRSTGRRRHMAS